MTSPERQYAGLAVSQRKRQRRDRFVASATTLFADYGYRNCSIADVCAGAALSKRQFYEEFDTREDILLAAYDRTHHDQASAVSAAIGAIDRPGRAPWRDLRTVAGAYLGVIVGDPAKARIVHVEVVGVSDRVDRHRAATRVAWTRQISAAVQAIAGTDATLRVDPELAASALMGAAYGMVQDWRTALVPATLTQLVDLFVPVAASLIVDFPWPEPGSSAGDRGGGEP